MVLGVGNVQLETLQLQTTANGETCPVGTLALVVADSHLVSPTEVIAASNVDGLSQKDVNTYGKVIDELRVPVVDA